MRSSTLFLQGLCLFVLLVAAMAFQGEAEAGIDRLSPRERDRTARLCDHAVAVAAERHKVPQRLLRSLGLVESGRKVDGARRIWPWTVNMEGAGRWFGNRADMLRYIRAEQAKGKRSFDIGCLQVNRRWHGQAFRSLDHMADPMASADYAARFLKELHAETGDWAIAAGYYHSRTGKHATRYRALVKAAYFSDASTPLRTRRLSPLSPVALQPVPGTAEIQAAPSAFARYGDAQNEEGQGAAALQVAAPKVAQRLSPWAHLQREFPLETIARQQREAPVSSLLRTAQNPASPGLLRQAKPLF
ncbi:MAG: lytic transglycosylase domain-containing protein [Pseudomonadota bacterium]